MSALHLIARRTDHVGELGDGRRVRQWVARTPKGHDCVLLAQEGGPLAELAELEFVIGAERATLPVTLWLEPGELTEQKEVAGHPGEVPRLARRWSARQVVWLNGRLAPAQLLGELLVLAVCAEVGHEAELAAALSEIEAPGVLLSGGRACSS